MKKKLCAPLAVLLCLLVCLSGCGARTSQNSSAMQYAENPATAGAGIYPAEDAAGAPDAVVLPGSAYFPEDLNRKIIWYVDLQVETVDFDGFVRSAGTLITDFDGFVQSSSLEGNASRQGTRRYGYLEARIPSGQLDAFLEQVGELGTVTHTNRHSDDVTLDYTDIEARIEMLEKQQTRLLELLAAAQTLDEIIQLESRLAEVGYQLESYTSSKNRYDSLIDYSTVTLRVQEVGSVMDHSTGERIAAGWKDSWQRLFTGIVDFFVWIVIYSPFILLWVVITAVVAFVAVKMTKRSKKKRTAPQAAAANRPVAPDIPANKDKNK